MRQENNINLSIVIPVYNEDKYLPKLFDELIVYFNFKNVEVSRGFYELSLNKKPNNVCSIILNPDEIDVQINFATSRLASSKQDTASK